MKIPTVREKYVAGKAVLFVEETEEPKNHGCRWCTCWVPTPTQRLDDELKRMNVSMLSIPSDFSSTESVSWREWVQPATESAPARWEKGSGKWNLNFRYV